MMRFGVTCGGTFFEKKASPPPLQKSFKVLKPVSVYLRFNISHRVHREHRVFINRGWTRINADGVLDGLGLLVGFYNICVYRRLSAV
jgi:hypothetical protein